MDTVNGDPIQRPSKMIGSAKRLLLSSAVAVISFHAPSFVSPGGRAYACGNVCAGTPLGGSSCKLAGPNGKGYLDCSMPDVLKGKNPICTYKSGGKTCLSGS
jgi:hypothetical protein